MHVIGVVVLVGSAGDAVQVADVEALGQLVLFLVDVRYGNDTSSIIKL